MNLKWLWSHDNSYVLRGNLWRTMTLHILKGDNIEKMSNKTKIELIFITRKSMFAESNNIIDLFLLIRYPPDISLN